jgi:murein DD-endopeptidase MepM/ murein hydrolase activator NlpD
MNRFFSKMNSGLIAESDVICISGSGVRSKKIGTIFLIWNISLAGWLLFATVGYFKMKSEILKKNEIVTELESTKQKLLSELVLFNKDIVNMKNFIVSLNRYDRFATIDGSQIDSDDSLIIADVNNVKVVLNRITSNTRNLNFELAKRANKLESLRDKLQLKNVQLVSYDKIEELIDDKVNKDGVDKDVLESIMIKKTLDSNIEHLAELEKFMNAMPFSEPVQSLYVSSKYGKRVDPFLKTTREHHGVDLVGSYRAKILAPADGMVVFEGTKGGYGKTIVLEHAYGIKTIYGHLNSYYVRVGDKIKRGEVIGLQGNTGRSTGQHLHYEVTGWKDVRYDPSKFISVGSSLY